MLPVTRVTSSVTCVARVAGSVTLVTRGTGNETRVCRAEKYQLNAAADWAKE